MYVTDPDWLAKRTEAVLDPELEIIDPHHHLWEHPGMTRYLLPDLHADTGAGHNVIGTVFIDCTWGYRADSSREMRPVGETETVAAVAEQQERDGTGTPILGIVSFADLTLAERVGEVLDAHVEAGHGRFRGIRHVTAFDADDRVHKSHTRPTAGVMGEPSFRRGMQELTARGLTFDAWLYHPQIKELTALARALPEQKIVLDHLGGLLGEGPYEGRRQELLPAWRDDIAELATCPNVSIKLGGIGMVIFGLGFEQQPLPPTSDDLVAAWGGPITHAIESFGVERCMFESNFPVDKMSCSYVTLWNAFKKIAVGASENEKVWLFRDAAKTFYGL